MQSINQYLNMRQKKLINSILNKPLTLSAYSANINLLQISVTIPDSINLSSSSVTLFCFKPGTAQHKSCTEHNAFFFSRAVYMAPDISENMSQILILEGDNHALAVLYKAVIARVLHVLIF